MVRVTELSVRDFRAVEEAVTGVERGEDRTTHETFERYVTDNDAVRELVCETVL